MAEEAKNDETDKGSAAKTAHQGACGTTLPTITIVGIVGNLATVVGVVIMNKYIQKHHGLNAMIFLSFCHFVTTALGIRLLLAIGFFRYKAAKASSVAPARRGVAACARSDAPPGRPRLARLGSLHESQPRAQLRRLLPDLQAGLHPRHPRSRVRVGSFNRARPALFPGTASTASPSPSG